jgi:hypothetical protein
VLMMMVVTVMIIMKIMVINFYIDDSDHDGDNYIQSVVIMMVTSNNNGDNIHDAYSPRKSSKVLTSQSKPSHVYCQSSQHFCCFAIFSALKE